MERIAHALLISVPRRDPACGSDPLAGLDREWRLVARLAGSFDRVALLLPPGGIDGYLDPRTLHPTPDVIESGIDVLGLAESLPLGASVAIRTLGLDGHDHALAARRLLRKNGHASALVARARQLNSRRLVREFGPDSLAAETVSLAERRIAEVSDFVVASDDALLEDLAWRDALPLERHRRIPDFVDDSQDPWLPEQRENASVLCVARLEPSSRLDALIHACAELRRSEAELQLEIVGSGLDRLHLTALADELGVPLSLPGNLPYETLLDRMRRCTVYVQPSFQDALGAPVFEAMSCGCPVVLPEDTPPDPALQHGATVLRVPATSDGIAFAMGGLIPDRDWRELVGLAASRSARATRSLTRVAEVETVALANALTMARSRLAAAA